MKFTNAQKSPLAGGSPKSAPLARRSVVQAICNGVLAFCNGGVRRDLACQNDSGHEAGLFTIFNQVQALPEQQNDGWFLIAPYGDHPGVLQDRSGSGLVTRNVIQRIDREAGVLIRAAFESSRSAIPFLDRGLPIWEGHPDKPGRALGRIKGVRNGAEGIEAHLVFNPSGASLVRGEGAAYTGGSPSFAVREIDGDTVQPIAMDHFGLTNQPNFSAVKVALNQAKNQPTNHMIGSRIKELAEKAGLKAEDVASTMGVTTTVLNEIYAGQITSPEDHRVLAIATRLSVPYESLAGLRPTKTTMNQSTLTKLNLTVAASQAEIDTSVNNALDAAATAEAEKAALATQNAAAMDGLRKLHVSNAIDAGAISEADRPAWEQNFSAAADVAAIAAVAKELSGAKKAALNTHNQVGAAAGSRPSVVNNVEGAVREAANEHGLDLTVDNQRDQAWLIAGEKHPELFGTVGEMAAAASATA